MNVYGEEQLNTYKPSNQQAPQVAVLTDGSYIVVWNSEGQDGSGSGVYGQHFTSAGVPIGPEFRVNTVTDSTQGNARVAATGNGGFVVTWEDSSGIDGSGQGVIGQRYDASGLAAGSNFVVNATTSSTQNSPATAG